MASVLCKEWTGGKKHEDGSQRLIVRDGEMKKNCNWQDEEHRSGCMGQKEKRKKYRSSVHGHFALHSPPSQGAVPERARCSAFPRLPLYTKARAVQLALCELSTTL